MMIQLLSEVKNTQEPKTVWSWRSFCGSEIVILNIKYYSSFPQIYITLSSSKLEIMTNKVQGNPSGVPLAISIWSGQPQPQKLNGSDPGVLSAGRFSKLRKVRSNGIVTDDWVESLSMVLFLPFTRSTEFNEYRRFASL